MVVGSDEDGTTTEGVPAGAASDGAGEDAASGGRTKGAQGWRNVRAVMAYYCTLRKIKRNVAFCILCSIIYIIQIWWVWCRLFLGLE